MKKRFLGAMLCICMLIVTMSTTALALNLSELTIKDATYYDSGALKGLTAEFYWKNASAKSRLVLMSKTLRSAGEEGTNSSYGDFTNYGYYGKKFMSFDEVINWDNTYETFGIISYSSESNISIDNKNTLSISFEENALPLDENKIYYVYMWTHYNYFVYPDALICAIQVCDGAVKYSTATDRNSYDESIIEKVESQTAYNVKVIPAENMSITSDSGAEAQNDLTTAMTPVVYTADTGYYFPEDYSVDTVNGIMVRRDNENQITVYGTPSKNAELTLIAPTKVPEPVTPVFDFTSLRTLKTKSVTVNHDTKTIDLYAADDAEYVTIFVHQKDVIPGGTFKMASYMGNKVVYDPNGSYRVYFVHNFTVPVKANITINGVSEQYLVNVHFDASKAAFDFTELKGDGFGDVTVNHENKAINITANDNADNITLYVNQHNTVYGGKLRMASYMGNKVTYDGTNGVYTIFANGKNSVSVKANITINGTTEQYLITVDFPAITWGFDTVSCDNVKNVSIDHENKTVTLDVNDGCDSILLYIDQSYPFSVKGQIWMKSYMGNKVVYNSADRTYTITKKDKASITVKTKITMLGETRYYDMIINFAENN